MAKLIGNSILVFLTFLTLTQAGQAQTDVLDKNLLDSTTLNRSNQIILLLETDTFFVYTTTELFKEQFEKWLNEHPDIENDKILFHSLLSDSVSKSINALIIADSIKLAERLEFRTADILQSGNCVIFIRKKEHLEKYVQISNYSTIGYEGRRFMINNSWLLETLEIVY